MKTKKKSTNKKVVKKVDNNKKVVTKEIKKNNTGDIKKDLNKIYMTLLGIVLLILVVIFIPKGDKNAKIKLQIIKYDVKDNSVSVVKEFNVKQDDEIDLDKYNGNDIDILWISEDNVKISREVTKYEIIDEEERKTVEYEQLVVEKVDFDSEFSIEVDEKDPFGPAYEQPRYHYNAKFVK